MMKKKYTYKSDMIYLFCFTMPILVVLMPIAFAEYSMVLAYASFIVLFLVIIGLGILLDHMPASFEADDEAVTFHLLLRTIHIPYTSIRSMEVSREYTKAIVRGEIPHYVEKLRIVTEDDEYDFHAEMQIDMEEIAKHPEKLQTYFDNGIFRQLQIYVESHR
ncbi:MAG: hypothetical protein IJ265_01295 [Oscillospiraceae bacterium]|nr:hypothetical protein [Oscillospiraceae bacterium]